MGNQILAWPSRMGRFKLGLNYVPRFMAQHMVAALRYQQLLWLLGETVAEAGTMNIFAVFDHTDGRA
jgi:branched-chain amino acid aminotransferase